MTGFNSKRRMAADKAQDGKCKLCIHGCAACDARAQPAQEREWVGLTVQERNDCLVQADPNECLNDLEAHQLMVEVEAKLKEKNL